MREAQEISSSPSADYTATPLETDLFEWHFTLRGPPKSCYAEGIYHGRIVLPPTYPLRPPSFRFVTPSGRFEANREICLSISGHHEETWQPAWGVRTALVALRSFMETDPKGQLGGLETSDAVRRRLAAESRGFRCAACGKSNAAIMQACEAAAQEHEAAQGASSEEIQVPSELKMGWRDEIAAAAKANSEGAGAGAGEDAESAELAEGFVQTAAPREDGPAPAASIPARPAQGVPQPTRTVPLPPPAQARVATAQRTPARQTSTEGVPVWVDQLIVVLAVLLAAVVLKVMVA